MESEFNKASYANGQMHLEEKTKIYDPHLDGTETVYDDASHITFAFNGDFSAIEAFHWKQFRAKEGEPLEVIGDFTCSGFKLAPREPDYLSSVLSSSILSGD